MSAAEVLPRDATAIVVGSPSHRAELLAVSSQALSAGCDSVSIAVYGEEIHRGPLDRTPELQRDRLLAVIFEDAAERDAATRHTYTVIGWRGDREVSRGTIRITGSARNGGASSPASFEATTAGALRLTLRHLEAVTGTMVKSHATTTEIMAAQLKEAHARTKELEHQNDALRAELRNFKDGAAVELARVEADRERQRVYRELGAQLIKYLPFVLSKWFPMPTDKPGEKPGAGEPQPTPPPELIKAVGAVVSALSSTTDEQLERMRGSLSPAQLEVIERARAGREISARELAPLSDLDSEGARRALEVLRPDQLEQFANALPTVAAAIR